MLNRQSIAAAGGADAGVITETGRVARSPRARPRWISWNGWRRILRHGMAIAVLAGAGVAAYQHRAQIAQAGGILANVHGAWLFLAVCTELASMVVFARLQRWLLRAGGVEVSLLAMIEITLAGNAMSTSLPGGPAWSATWAFGQLRRRGADRQLAGWVILVAGALASFAVFVILAAGAWVAGSRGPVADLRWLAAALAAIPVLVVIGFGAAARSNLVRRGLSGVWRRCSARVGVMRAAGRVAANLLPRLRTVNPGLGGWLEAFGLALANWLYDAACLVACIEALGIGVPWRGLLVIYGLTKVSASLPITPGGLGVVEGSMTALLVAYGSTSADALAAVLLYRIVSFWGLVPIGWAAWFVLEIAHRHGVRKRAHPWADHQHGPDPAPAEPALGPEMLFRPSPCSGCPDGARSTSQPAGRRARLRLSAR